MTYFGYRLSGHGYSVYSGPSPAGLTLKSNLLRPEAMELVRELDRHLASRPTYTPHWASYRDYFEDKADLGEAALTQREYHMLIMYEAQAWEDRYADFIVTFAVRHDLRAGQQIQIEGERYTIAGPASSKAFFVTDARGDRASLPYTFLTQHLESRDLE